MLVFLEFCIGQNPKYQHKITTLNAEDVSLSKCSYFVCKIGQKLGIYLKIYLL